MCGRFSATNTFREIKIRWNLQGDFSFEPRYNIAPSQSVPVIIQGGRGFDAKLMKWGLVPSWSKDPSVGNRMINARAETLLEKPSFRDLVERRRCVIPADGFYEWRRDDDRKVPVWFHLKSREPFVFAGLWDSWRHPKVGDALHSFTIITTEPNALMSPIHNRMPVICDEATGREWLERNHGPQSILRPWPAELMQAHDVSNFVNAPENDTPECIKPLPPDYVPPGQLSLI